MNTLSEASASAGTLESSDCLVTVSPHRGPEEGRVTLSGANAGLFAARNGIIVKETVAKYGLSKVSVNLHDNGALEVTVRARVETALERFISAVSAGGEGA